MVTTQYLTDTVGKIEPLPPPENPFPKADHWLSTGKFWRASSGSHEQEHHGKICPLISQFVYLLASPQTLDRRRCLVPGMAVVVVDAKARLMVSGPDIISKGFIFEGEQTPMLGAAKEIIGEILSRALSEPTQDWLEIQVQIGKALRKYFFKLLERRPMILPIILTL